MFKRKVDKRLRTVMTKEPYELPDSYQERVKQTLESLPEQRCKTRCYRKRAIALVPVVVLLLAVSSASAGSLIEEHLSQMSDEEVQRYLDTVDNYLYIQEDSYTRELTDKERQRMQEMEWAYEQGTFPEAELPIYNTVEQAEGTLYCYIAENGTFKLPDAELTDEQLLQLIDFHEKREYSMEQKKRNSSENEEEQVIIGVTEEETIENARELVERFYQVDISEHNTVSEISRTYYDIAFKKDGYGYWVRVDGASGQASSMALYIPGGLNKDDCLLDETVLVEGYYTTRKALEEYLPAESTIIRGGYVYEGNDTIICRGTAHYVFEDSNGNVYELGYSLNTNQIHAFNVYSDYSVVLEYFENDEEVNKINNENVSWTIIDME